MIDLDTVTRDFGPGGGPGDMRGWTVPVPIATTAGDVPVMTTSCWLLGWSLREATGLGGAVVELLGGSGASGELLAAIALTAGFDPAASQTPASATATGAASAIAPSIGGGAGTTVFIESFRIEGLGATAASVIAATLTGVQGGTITYEVNIPAGATVAIAPVTDSWPGRGLPASGAGVAITLNVPSFGAGNTFSEAEVQGYVQTAAGVSDTQWFGGNPPYCRSGVVLHPVSGSVRGVVWVAI
jgi:hypothetical protein